MTARLHGKVAVITGTGRGMARQVALRLAAEGASIVGCDIDAEAAEETQALVRSAGGKMESMYPVDLSIEESAHDLAEFAAEKFGGIDILHNNAMQLRLGSVEDSSFDDWHHTVTHTLTVPFLVSKHVIPHLRARGGGSIIFMGSVAGANIGTGYPGNLPILAAYSVAKAGVIRLASVLTNELAPDNIRVNTISPGCVATPNGLLFYGTEGSEQRRVTLTPNLIDRLGEPDDIADAVLYLASDDARWVTGLNLAIDGGHHASGGFGPARADDIAAYVPSMAEMSHVDHWPTRGRRVSQ